VKDAGQAGASARVAKNSLDIVGDGSRLVFNILSGDIDNAETARAVMRGYTEDVRDLASAYRDLEEASKVGRPGYWDEKMAERKAEREKANKAAKDTAWGKDFSRSFGQSFDEAVKKWEKSQADAKAAREKAAADAEAARKRAKEDRKKEQWDFLDDRQRELKKSLEDAGKETKELGESFGLDQLQASLDETANDHVPNFTASVLDSFSEIEAARAVLQDAFADLFTGASHNAREFFAQFAQGMANIFAQLAALQAQEAITGYFDKLLSGISWGKGSSAGSGVGDWMTSGAAKGKAFEHGQVIPLARGGIVHGPTVFPMARGFGLMGEAGPEAVVPLKRTSSGKLGVASTMPNITVVNQTGVTATARVERGTDRMSVILQAAQMGADMAEARINRSMRTGYGATAQSVQQTYGLRRRS